MQCGMVRKSSPSLTVARSTMVKLAPRLRAIALTRSAEPPWAWAPMTTSPSDCSSKFHAASLGMLARQGGQLTPQNSSSTTRFFKSSVFSSGPSRCLPSRMPSTDTFMLNPASACPTRHRTRATTHGTVRHERLMRSLLSWTKLRARRCPLRFLGDRRGGDFRAGARGWRDGGAVPADAEETAQAVRPDRFFALPFDVLIGAEDAVPPVDEDAEVVLPHVMLVVQRVDRPRH